MIAYTEIKQVAARLGVDPGVVEHDYVLGCFLHFLALDEHVREAWVFKGGTCLAKCHFQEYRFSEDLDFTALRRVEEQSLKQVVKAVGSAIQRDIGVRTDVKEPVVETIEDEYGKESFEAKVYYRGPSEMTGSPRSIRVHINRDEILVFPTSPKSILSRVFGQRRSPCRLLSFVLPRRSVCREVARHLRSASVCYCERSV